MGLKDLFKSKRTPFDELWKQIEGIPDGAKNRLPVIFQKNQETFRKTFAKGN